MKREYFENLEALDEPTQVELNTVIDKLAFNDDGLIPVITQDNTSKKVLMFAWMNKQAIYQTIETKKVTYWSRSRQEIWVKGETSGHVQNLISMNFDCDGDTILCQVDQSGAACHTGRSNCFYLQVDLSTQHVLIPKAHQS